MARMRSEGGESLRTYPLTPALSASLRRRAPPSAVKMTIGAPRLVVRRLTSSPMSAPARQGSTTTTSGAAPLLDSSAASRFSAPETSASGQVEASSAITPSRTTGCSSMMRQRDTFSGFDAMCEKHTLHPIGVLRCHRAWGQAALAAILRAQAQPACVVDLEAGCVHGGTHEDDDRERVEPQKDDEHEHECRPEAGDGGDVGEVGRKGVAHDSDGNGRERGTGPDSPPWHQPVRDGPIDHAKDREEQEQAGREADRVDQSPGVR